MNSYNDKKVLIISAHPDDEAFGMGGTLARLSSLKNTDLYWLVITMVWEPKWSNDKVTKRAQAIQSINQIIQFKEVIMWNYKDNCLDQIPKNELQDKMINVFDLIKPNIVFTPSPWDFNFEHRLIFEIVEMSSKAYYSKYIEEILSYEIPSSSDAAFGSYRCFICNTYIDIKNFIDQKMALIKLYDTEIYEFPHPRSIEYILSLAKKRGGEAGLMFAEAFHLFRKINK